MVYSASVLGFWEIVVDGTGIDVDPIVLPPWLPVVVCVFVTSPVVTLEEPCDPLTRHPDKNNVAVRQDITKIDFFINDLLSIATS